MSLPVYNVLVPNFISPEVHNLLVVVLSCVLMLWAAKLCKEAVELSELAFGLRKRRVRHSPRFPPSIPMKRTLTCAICAGSCSALTASSPTSPMPTCIPPSAARPLVSRMGFIELTLPCAACAARQLDKLAQRQHKVASVTVDRLECAVHLRAESVKLQAPPQGADAADEVDECAVVTFVIDARAPADLDAYCNVPLEKLEAALSAKSDTAAATAESPKVYERQTARLSQKALSSPFSVRTVAQQKAPLWLWRSLART